MADETIPAAQDELTVQRKTSPFTTASITVASMASFAGGGYFCLSAIIPGGPRRYPFSASWDTGAASD